MNSLKASLILCVVLLPMTALAQSATTNFLPLEVGNAYTYHWILEPPFAPPDTFWVGPYVTSESITIRDTTYYLSKHPFAFADTLRADPEGRIWARLQDRDMLLFDFTQADGAMYEFQYPEWPDVHFQVSVDRDTTVVVAGGRFENCIRMVFDDPQVLDEARSFIFAPGVGIVFAAGGMGEYEELYLAEVGGRVVTSIEERIESINQSPLMTAYPNPFRTSTTLAFPEGDRRPMRVIVFDVLGRMVARLLDGRCPGTPCMLNWDAKSLPNGNYFARVEQGGNIQTTILSLNR